MPKLKQRQQDNRRRNEERNEHEGVSDALEDEGVGVERLLVCWGGEEVVEEGGVAGGEEGDEEVGDEEGEDQSEGGKERALVRFGGAVTVQEGVSTPL